MQQDFKLPVLVVDLNFRVHSIFVDLISEQIWEVIKQEGAYSQIKCLILPFFKPVSLLAAQATVSLQGLLRQLLI